jgi:hypothetical protein
MTCDWANNLEIVKIVMIVCSWGWVGVTSLTHGVYPSLQATPCSARSYTVSEFFGGQPPGNHGHEMCTWLCHHLGFLTSSPCGPIPSHTLVYDWPIDCLFMSHFGQIISLECVGLELFQLWMDSSQTLINFFPPSSRWECCNLFQIFKRWHAHMGLVCPSTGAQVLE